MKIYWPRERLVSGFDRRAKKRGLLRDISGAVRALEIGPFDRPALEGKRVKYVDVSHTEALRKRAADIGRNPKGVPNIDYIAKNGDLSGIPKEFDLAFSSHCIEHQPDIVRHINQVAGILVPGGCYYLLIPDKRYCFDHYLPESTLADVLQAHEERRRTHTLRSVIEHRALTTHNQSWKHWLGMHRSKSRASRTARVASAIEEFRRADGEYVDVHAWQFTPLSFLTLTSELSEMGLIDMHPERVWKTPFPRLEFAAVLRTN